MSLGSSGRTFMPRRSSPTGREPWETPTRTRQSSGHGDTSGSHLSNETRPLEVCWESGGTHSGYALLLFLSQGVKGMDTWANSSEPHGCQSSGCSRGGCVLRDECVHLSARGPEALSSERPAGPGWHTGMTVTAPPPPPPSTPT